MERACFSFLVLASVTSPYSLKLLLGDLHLLSANELRFSVSGTLYCCEMNGDQKDK